MSTRGYEEPPEGVVSGDTVPRENDQKARHEGRVDRLSTEMKAHPAYCDKSEGERREIAREKIAAWSNQ